MAAKRYQLRLIGHGALQEAGQHVLRITAHATVDSVDEQIKQLFELSADARLRIFDAGIDDNDDCTQQPTLVAVSLRELVQGILEYFSNDMEPAFLAISKPEVLVDAIAPAPVKHSTASSSRSASDAKPSSNIAQQYHPKPWTPALDALWPFCIPR